MHTSFTVVLLATSPAYFRGFTLIALKEGREGTTDDDYTGQFQVRLSRCGEKEEGGGIAAYRMCSLLLGKVPKRWTHLYALMHMGFDLAAPCCLLVRRLKEVLLTDATQLPWMKLESCCGGKRKRFLLPLWCSSFRVRQTWHHSLLNSRYFFQRKKGKAEEERKRHIGTERKEINKES